MESAYKVRKLTLVYLIAFSLQHAVSQGNISVYMHLIIILPRHQLVENYVLQNNCDGKNTYRRN
jgi:hypothetical protein